MDSGIDWLQGGIHVGQEWLCDNAGVIGCGAGNILGGLADGLLEGIQDIADGVFDIIRDVAGIVGSILRLDFAGALNELVDLILDVVDTILDVVRLLTLGYFIGAIVAAYERAALRDFVSDLVNDRFANQPERLARIRRNIGLDDGRFGLRIAGESRVFVLDSDNVPLADWHRRGLLDLYAMAGLLSFDSFQVARARTVVKLVGPNGEDSALPVGRLQISRFLESEGRLWRLRVYALSRQAVAQHLRAAKDKLEQLGVRIDWNDGERFAWFRSYTHYDLTSEAEFTMSSFDAPEGDDLAVWTVNPDPERRLRDGSPDEDCTVLALGSFKVPPQADLGLVFARDIDEGDDADPCDTPGRTDRCCITIKRTVDDSPAGSGVIYKDLWPQTFLGYVLPHEIGHYLGLCHYGHDGIQNIMYTKAEKAGLEMFTWGTLWGYYRDNQPRFTLDDAKNSWRFIVDQMPHCLDPEGTSPEVE